MIYSVEVVDYQQLREDGYFILFQQDNFIILLIFIASNMKRKKQINNPQSNPQAKFLTKHHSTSNLFFFSCCSPAVPNQPDEKLAIHQKSNTSKLSMKNILKKSAIYGSKNHLLGNESKSHVTSNISDNLSFSRGHTRKASQLSNFSQRNINNQKVVKRGGGNIKFSYKRDRNQPENSIHNYHTTNYIVEKYIVKPQEMNIIVTNRRDVPVNHIYNPSQQQYQNQRYFDLSHQFQEDDEIVHYSPKWKDESLLRIPEPVQFKPNQSSQKTPNQMSAFSFGHHQKTQMMSKYLKMGMKEVQSKRQSQNSKESGQQRFSQRENTKVQGKIAQRQESQLFIRANLNQSSLNRLIKQEVSAMDSDQVGSESQNSEVIDDYRSIMKRMSEKVSSNQNPT